MQSKCSGKFVIFLSANSRKKFYLTCFCFFFKRLFCVLNFIRHKQFINCLNWLHFRSFLYLIISKFGFHQSAWHGLMKWKAPNILGSVAELCCCCAFFQPMLGSLGPTLRRLVPQALRGPFWAWPLKLLRICRWWAQHPPAGRHWWWESPVPWVVWAAAWAAWAALPV